MRSFWGWTSQVLAWLVILTVALGLMAAVLLPRLAGATPYTVLTGSMQPTYPPGTLVVVKPSGDDAYGVGDVISYQLESGKATVVTHRVVGVSTNLKGETSYTTRGDANNAPDEQPVRLVQVKGQVWYAVPYLGHASNALTGRQRHVAVYSVAAGLLGYAAFMFASAVRDRRRRRSAPTATGTTTS